ncbi:MAG: DNA recombination protein RmuC, partial [Pseudomonadota bacterium]|nr:DNA recombination protein RmuC [Pseudomonadota bacterium]
DSLTKALRGDVKAQGNWGEVMLERILEESGLRKGEDYVLQGEAMGLSGEDGGRQRPDVIIKLPDDKHVIIDAKVSLTAYERYCADGDESHLRDFLKSVRNHVAGLESKRYQDNDKLNTPDVVMLFMPVEGAFALAMQQDRELHQYAWGKRIVIVSPTMLFANLRTIASLWRIERQNRYAYEIADQGGRLYDKFVGFIEDMQLIGRQMSGLHKSYDSAMNKLSEGRGNLVGSVEKLKSLGAKASKSLPKDLLAEESSFSAGESEAQDLAQIA